MTTNSMTTRLGVITWLFACTASGAYKKQEENHVREALAKLVAGKRDAIMVASAGAWSPGAFISRDRHALVDGQALLDKRGIKLALREQVDALIKDGKDLGHPVPAEHNPIDPAVIGPDWHPLNMAGQRGDWVEVRRRAAALLKRHPNSKLLDLQMRRADFALFARNAAAPLLAFPEPDAREPLAHQVEDWANRGRILRGRGEFDAAIKAYQKAVALSPKDYPFDRYSLAKAYIQAQRLKDAEDLLREIHPTFRTRRSSWKTSKSS